MKCDELEKFDATSNAERSAGIESRYAYDADEVDAAIAELKDEITRKEGVEKRWFEQCMEARAENVRLKRALWLSRAERAMAESYSVLNDVPTSNRWVKALNKLNVKAKEYK